jgi:hypothetical protein
VGQRIFECVFLIGTRSAKSIMASGTSAALTGRTRDRTRPMLRPRQKVLATFATCSALPGSVENGLKHAPLVGHPFEAMFSALIEGKP